MNAGLFLFGVFVGMLSGIFVGAGVTYFFFHDFIFSASGDKK